MNVRRWKPLGFVLIMSVACTTICLVGRLVFTPKSHYGLLDDSPRITDSVMNETGRGFLLQRIRQEEGYDKVMASRYLRVDKHCPSKKINTSWRVEHHLLINLHFKFILCFVPKAGSTFWKNVLHALDDPGISPERFTWKLFNPDSLIHHVDIPFIGAKEIPNPESFYRTSRTIVFTRNPYTRLFSAYVSKFVLPGSWSSLGRNVIKLVRPDAREKSLKCGHDVTFEEFLRYVLHAEQTGTILSAVLDDHWAPVTSLCDVCKMKYDYIGKQESFSADVDYIFRQLGVDKLVVKNGQKLDSIRVSIESALTDNRLHRSSKCVSRQGTLRRIWYSLQAQGHMTFDSEPPWQNLDLSTATRSEVIQAFQTSYDQNKPTAEQRKQQRHKALIDAYSTVPVDVKRGIQHVFQYDFELFGYDKEPQLLF